MTITDGNKTIKVVAYYSNTGEFSRCKNIAADILVDASYKYDDSIEAYVVNDIDAVIDYVNDWHNLTGDCANAVDADEDRADEIKKRYIDITFCGK